jgi:hypothetical protein
VNGNGKNPCSGTPPSVKLDNSYKGSTLTLNPGVYGGIDDSSSTPLVLNPGIYVITGLFKDVAQSVITGNGVMLYFTCPSNQAPYYTACTTSTSTSGGSLNLTGGSTVVLSAPTNTQATYCGMAYDTDSDSDACPSTDAYTHQPAYVPADYTGLLIFQDRKDTLSMSLAGSSSSAPPTTSCTSVSSGSSCISGTVYVPDGGVSISGGGSQQTALMSYVIADTVTFTGSVNNGGSAQTFAMSFPLGLNAPLAATNGLVE